MILLLLKLELAELRLHLALDRAICILQKHQIFSSCKYMFYVTYVAVLSVKEPKDRSAQMSGVAEGGPPEHQTQGIDAEQHGKCKGCVDVDEGQEDDLQVGIGVCGDESSQHGIHRP